MQTTVLVLVALIASLVVCAPVTAQEADPAHPPLPRASGPSISELWKKVRNKVKGNKEEEQEEPTAQKLSPPPGTEATPQSHLPAGSAADSGGQSAGAPIKIKEFGSGKPQPWNDGRCRNLVEPFDLTDSALSLGKVKATKLVDEMMGQPQRRATRVKDRKDIEQAARQLNWLPMSMEVQIGERIHAAQPSLLREDSKGGQESYRRALRLLDSVLARVGEQHPYRFQIFVTTASEGNAEAAPGGFIYVDKDLVDQPAAEPRALFAIAHEVSHVLQRHRTRETQMRLADGVDSMDGLGKLMASARGNDVGVLLRTAGDLKRMFVRHSEEQELQADGCAVRLVYAATGDGAEASRSVGAFLDALGRDKARKGPMRAVRPKRRTADEELADLTDGEFSRHPTTDQRKQNLKRVLADLRGGR